MEEIKGSCQLNNGRLERTARLVAEGRKISEAWYMTAPPEVKPKRASCLCREYTLNHDAVFQERLAYLKTVEKSKVDIDDHEKMSKRLWEIINGSGGDASKDADVIRAISELAKLKERAMSLEEAKANVASVVAALTDIVRRGVGDFIVGNENMFVRKLSETLGCGVAISVGGTLYKSWNEVEERKDGQGNAKDRDGSGTEGESEDKYNGSKEGITVGRGGVSEVCGKGQEPERTDSMVHPDGNENE